MNYKTSFFIGQTFDLNNFKLYAEVCDNRKLIITGSKEETFFQILGKVKIEVYLENSFIPSYLIEGQ